MGRKTASGQIFRQYKKTAAHKTLPFGAKVKVTNLSNGKSVKVRINDRGPFVFERKVGITRIGRVDQKLRMVRPRRQIRRRRRGGIAIGGETVQLLLSLNRPH